MSSGTRLKSRPLSALVAAAVVGAGAVALATPAAAATGGVLVYGLTEANQIVQFRAQSPATILATSPALALAADENLVGIDVRPANGALYGVVDGPVFDRVVTIDPATGAELSRMLINTQLSGTAFGVDFNPVPDRLRVVSNTGQNLRIDVTTGAVTTDGALNPGGFDVRGAAYTNNVNGATGTQLFDLDVSGADELLLQNPPNNGTLAPVGPTGTDVATPTATVGFDIEAVTNAAYAVLNNGAARDFGTVALATGAFTRVGSFPAGLLVEDVAVASPRFSVADTSANEGSNATVVVTRSGDAADTATVQLALTTGGTAGSAATTDFTAATPTVTFASGARTATATVALTADTLAEPSETFTATITTSAGPGGNASVSDGTAIITILNGPAGPAACATPAQVVLGATTIIATGSAPVSVRGTPGTVVDLFAYTRPSTTYRLVRSGTVGADGTVAFTALRPPANTRLYAVERGCVVNAARDSVVLNVRTALSLFVSRTGKQSYRFSGDSLPARPGGLIVSLYRVTPNGRQVLTSQTRASATTGDWVINRTFTGTGRFGFVVRTGQDLQNAPGTSNVRSLLVF